MHSSNKEIAENFRSLSQRREKQQLSKSLDLLVGLSMYT